MRCLELLEGLNLSYASVPASVPLARSVLVEFAGAAGATATQVEAVRWAASEALTNVVLHAYGDSPGEIYVTAAVTGGQLWLLIADDGRGLDASSDSPGLGLGLGLIARMTDDLVIAKRASGGAELRMGFKLAATAGAKGDQDRGSVACASRPASSRFSTTR